MTDNKLELAILQQFVDKPMSKYQACRLAFVIFENVKSPTEKRFYGAIDNLLRQHYLCKSNYHDAYWPTEAGLAYFQENKEKEQSMSTNNLSRQEQQQLFALLHKSLTPEQREEALATEVDKEKEFYDNITNFLGENLGGVFRNRNWMSRLTSKASAFIVEDKDGDSHFEADNVLGFNHLYSKYVCGWGENGYRTQESPSEKQCEPQAFQVEYCSSSGGLIFHEITGIKLNKNGYTHILGDLQGFEVPQSLRGTQ